jgi:hypothetical protein
VDLIAEGSTTGTPYSRGRATQDALRARYGEAYARADQMYDDVRAAAGEIDVRALKKLAKTEKIDIGGDLGKRSAIPFSEAQELKSRLNERASTLRAEGNALEAADYERLAGSLSSQLNAAADQAGVGNLYRQADQFYATEIAGKFHKDATQRVIRFSGSKVVEDLTPSGERAHQRILGGTVEEARTIVTALRGMQDQPDALPLFRQGIVSTMLEKATDARGVLRPDLLLNMVKSPNVPPERLDTYLGKELADGLRDFATNYAKGRVRIQTGPQAAGMAATAVGAGAVGGLGAAVGAGVEVANEMGMLGGLIARSPRVMNTLKLAVLGQDEKALIGLLPSACLVTGQLAGASLRQLFAQPPEGEHVSY